MKLKSMFVLAMTGVVGLGAPLAAWASGTGAVPIEDLVLVAESGSATPSTDEGAGHYGRYGRHRDGRYRVRHRDGRYRVRHIDGRYRDRHIDGRYRDRHRDGRYRDGRYRIRHRWDDSGPGAGVELPTPRVGTEG